MYIPHQFQQTNLEKVKSFLRQNSFGILVNQVNKRPWASHIPLELEETPEGIEVLYGHVSKANPQWKTLFEEQSVLAIFQGPHSYISSSLYDHENVPTWNYVAVHIYGKVKKLEEAELYHSLNQLVNKYEAHVDNPVSMDQFSEKTLRQMKGIVGFKLVIEEIQAAYKLSQNRHDLDHQNIINELENNPDPGAKGVAELMKKNRGK